MERLISCQYCGAIHDSKFDCGMKPKNRKQYGNKEKFRNSKQWKLKRNHIHKRDLNLCQICIRELYNTTNKYTYDNLSVHHAESLEDAWEKRLDDDNLLLGCSYHHELMEDGTIPLEEVKAIIKEQQDKAKKLL